jgi:hypothetical protein
MQDQTYQTGKNAADAAYRANAVKPQAGSTQAQGTGQFVDLTKQKATPTPSVSLGEAAAKAKKDKAAAPAKKAVKVMGEFSKGGPVKKTGVYKVHKGERVLNPKQTKKAEKSSAMKSVLSGL